VKEIIDVQRSFIIGDSWLYYKIYTGHKTADQILTEVIHPVTKTLIEEGIIDKWFFIRYSDPKFHLRLRLHHNQPESLSRIVTSLRGGLREFVEDNIVWNVQVDTYQRELERYGLLSIEESETIFFHESQLTVSLLSMIEGSEGEEIRWLFALKAIDNLLDIFAYSGMAKLELLENLKTSFGKEFGMSRPLKKQLDEKYRKNSKKIEEFFRLQPGNAGEFEPIMSLISEREQNLKPSVNLILKCSNAGSLEMPINDLTGSHIHMLMNRLFRSKNRLHELVVYDFLYRTYKSQLARKKFQTTTN